MISDEKRAYNRAYYLSHKAEIKAQVRAYRATPAGKAMRKGEKQRRIQKYPEKLRMERAAYEKTEQRKQYMLKTRPRQLERRKAYHAQHRDRLIAKHDEWYEVHRDSVLVKRRANRDENTKANREWRKKNPDAARMNHFVKYHKRRARKKEAIVGVDLKAVAAKIRAIKSADILPCYWCGEPTARKHRHIDHIIPLNKRGKHSAENVCCSCPRCNCSKGDKLPHEFKPDHKGEGTAVSKVSEETPVVITPLA